MVLKKFESVGITLTAKDFDYSEYAHEYMKVFIEEAKKGNVYSDRIKDTFEKKLQEKIESEIIQVPYLKKAYNEYLKAVNANPMSHPVIETEILNYSN